MKEALPVGQRPKCRACHKELKPNYRTERTDEEKIIRKYTRHAYDAYGEQTRVQVPIEADARGAKQAADGRWYVERAIRVEKRTFLGTYGRYKDGLFCGLNCAYGWAVSVCAELDKRGQRWNVVKKVST